MTSFFPKSPKSGKDQETSASSPETGGQAGLPELEAVTPPFLRPGSAGPGGAAAGVVPPIAAPIYSMLPGVGLPHSIPPAGSAPYSVPQTAAQVQSAVEDAVAEGARVAQQTQQRVRVAIERTTAPASAPASAARRRPVQRAAPAPQTAPRPRPRQAFDPVAYAQTGLLNLAHNWAQSGAPLRAIHTYMQVLIRYPGTPAASAAVADLVEYADSLAEQGMFHAALSIYDRLEELV
jgi:hypothetical protein